MADDSLADIPVLALANKQDAPGALPVETIKERGFNRIAETLDASEGSVLAVSALNGWVFVLLWVLTGGTGTGWRRRWNGLRRVWCVISKQSRHGIGAHKFLAWRVFIFGYHHTGFWSFGLA